MGNCIKGINNDETLNLLENDHDLVHTIETNKESATVRFV